MAGSGVVLCWEQNPRRGGAGYGATLAGGGISSLSAECPHASGDQPLEFSFGHVVTGIAVSGRGLVPP